MSDAYTISEKFTFTEKIVVYPGDCLDLLRTIPDDSMQLIVTSPPYNIGKEYEKKTTARNLFRAAINSYSGMFSHIIT